MAEAGRKYDLLIKNVRVVRPEARALDDAATRNRLIEIGAQIPDTAHRTPQALQRLVESEVARWTPVLKPQEAPAK